MTKRVLGPLLGLLLSGCGQEIVAKKLNEPCTRDEQCEVGLECTAGVCQVADMQEEQEEEQGSEDAP